MKFIIGKKLHMTQIFAEDGQATAVTAVLAQPNVITQIKKNDSDGYSAIQVGHGIAKHQKKPQQGHLKDMPGVKTLREFRVEGDVTVSRGSMIDVSTFEKGDAVDVIGTSKGKGFQGVVKRHGFHGSASTHGHKDQERMPGSIGAGGVQRVFKNVRMAGRMGNEQVTIKGLSVVDVDLENNILYIKGAIPGSRSSLVIVSGPGDLKTVSAPAESVVEEVVETPAAESVAEVVEAAPEAAPETEAVTTEAAPVAEATEAPVTDNK